MNKYCLVAVFVLALCSTVIWTAEEQGFPLVSGICLLEDKAYEKSLPPGTIKIGLQARTDTLFKISLKDRVFDAGLLRKGFNTLSLPTKDFFQETDVHRFILDCRSDESIVTKEILIDIRLVPLYLVQKGSEGKKQLVYTVSFLIGNELLYATRKFSPSPISFDLELPPWEGRYNPFGLMDGTQKPATGIPLLGAVAGLYHLAKSLSPVEEKEEENTVPQKRQRIETTFLKTNAAGDVWQWKALILIYTNDLEKVPIS
jgi:hypothetical protein